jgi:hypothetical protein
MSNDPTDRGGDVPPPGPVDPYGYSPDVPRLTADVRLVQARVQGPAIGLIIVGVINLLLALYAGFSGLQAAAMPAEVEKQIEAMQGPENMKQLKQLGISIRDIITWEIYWFLSEGVLGMVTAILGIIAGVRMLSLKSYGFSVFTSILVAIPCISCSGCCGLGEGIGIWALVVLMNEEVKAAFR